MGTAVLVLIVLALFFSGTVERADRAINDEFGLHYPPMGVALSLR